MKRYRILSFDFDSRASSLTPVKDEWDDTVKENHINNYKNTVEGLSSQYGSSQLNAKITNFVAMGNKPFSVSAFHNKFLEQARNAFVIGSYYPALTGACALGERILNQLMLVLRNYHSDKPEYKKVYRKSSFDYWPLVIDTLESWGELLPEAAEAFRKLNVMRNKAIHFNPETDTNDRELALEAICTVQDIVNIQFSVFGEQPWSFSTPGEVYIKREWESKPLIKHIFIPNCCYVGYKHRVKTILPSVTISDEHEYVDNPVTDEEFVVLRTNR